MGLRSSDVLLHGTVTLAKTTKRRNHESLYHMNAFAISDVAIFNSLKYHTVIHRDRANM